MRIDRTLTGWGSLLLLFSVGFAGCKALNPSTSDDPEPTEQVEANSGESDTERQKAEEDRRSRENAKRQKAEENRRAREEAKRKKAEQDRLARDAAARKKEEQDRLAREEAARKKAEEDRLARATEEERLKARDLRFRKGLKTVTLNDQGPTQIRLDGSYGWVQKPLRVAHKANFPIEISLEPSALKGAGGAILPNLDIVIEKNKWDGILDEGKAKSVNYKVFLPSDLVGGSYRGTLVVKARVGGDEIQPHTARYPILLELDR